MIKDVSGQAIILSALVACICLLSISSLTISLRETASASYTSSALAPAVIDSILKSQDSGLMDCAARSSMQYTWSNKSLASGRFINLSGNLVKGLTLSMMKDKGVYSFSLNDSLARDYVNSHPQSGLINMNGTLLGDSSGMAVVRGYACDVTIRIGDVRLYRSGVKMV